MIQKYWRSAIVIAVLVSSLFIALTGSASAIATITPITFNNTVSFERPVVSGYNIAWQDARNGKYAIYLYSASTGEETRVSFNDASNQQFPAIDGDLIAYQDDREVGGGSDIYLYNITSRRTIQITNDPNDQSMPALSGNRIVWQDQRSGVYTIYVNGTAPGLESVVSSNPGSDQLFPAISGDLVVWQDDRNGNWDIYLENLTSHQETQITSDSSDQQYPAVSGNRIIWSDSRINTEIFINGTAPGREYSLTPGLLTGNPNEPPAIAGTTAVWAQGSPVEDSIYSNDTLTGHSYPVDQIPGSNPTYPRISVDPITGIRIVWEETRDPNHQIYLYSPDGPGTCPVAGFSSDFSGGSAPLTVQFSDQSSAGATHWFWDFGDGTISALENPVHTFTQNIPYDVSLTVGNPYCRNRTTVSNAVVVGSPVADFVASPNEDIVPATISFTDSSSGSPQVWNWSFGDGAWFNTTTAASKSPTHTYSSVGTYTVKLITNNTYGTTTRTRTNYITVLNGANEITDSSIDGLTFDYHTGQQVATVDTAHLSASLIPNASVLEIQPPADRGFRNITLYALDGSGFSQSGSTFTGRITGVHMESEEISPTGFSAATGSHVSVNYSIDLPSYPGDATLNTKVWEGAVTDDADKFSRIALGSNFAHYSGTAYTVKISKTNIPDGATAKLRMSLDSTWVASHGGRNTIYIERITDDSQTGEVLKTQYTGSDPGQNLDYFEADSPRGLCTFGISALSGSGNPFQLDHALHCKPYLLIDRC